MGRVWIRRGASSALVAATLVAVLATSACEAGTDAGGEPVPTPEPGEAPGPDRAREGDRPAEPGNGSLNGDDPAVDPCDDDEFEAVEGTVAEQLDAFADGEWERAYALASEAYREGVAFDEFVSLIEEHFPAVADPAGHTSTDCLTDGSRASILVTVTGRSSGDSETYLYLLELEDGDWRMHGATASAAPEPEGV